MENQNQEEKVNDKEEAPASAITDSEPKTNRSYKFIVGFVITIALLVFIISTIVLLVKVVPDTISLVAGTFRAIGQDHPVVNMEETQTDEATPLSVNDSSINSGETITISWEKAETNGTHALIFLCEESSGITIEHGEDFFECGDYLDFGQNETQVKISVIYSQKTFADLPIVLEFEKENGEINTVGEIVVTVLNKDLVDGVVLSEETSTSPAANSTNPQTSTSVPAHRDLAVRIIQAGPIVNGQIVNTGSFDGNSIVRIQFEIKNNGNISTGPWSFQAVLPTADFNSRLFNSGTQNSLAPGSGVIYTMTFSGLLSGTNQALISVDPQNLISESTETNNQARVAFTVSGGSSITNGTGRADFDIDLIAIGRISGSRFIETNNLDTRDELAIRFRVTNIGGKKTEDWRFEIDVDEPRGANNLDFRSKRFSELDPGESREITVSFDNIDEDGDYDFEIEVDSDRDTNERSRSNNTIKFDVDIDR